MSTIPEPPPIPRPKPPVLVWVISICFIFAAVCTVGSLLLVHSGILPMLPAQKQYFDSQTSLDYALIYGLTLVNMVGAVLFILLRRSAYYLFLTAFIVGLISVAYQIVARNWLTAVGGPSLVGVVFGWALMIAIIFYARHLVKTRVLR
jgi:hypothetical protein